jgi:hypothetical protein
MARSIHSQNERAAGASISAVEIRGEQEGEHRGGTPPPREVFPSLAPDFTRIVGDGNELQRPTASANFNQCRELRDWHIGRRLVPPDTGDTASEVVNRSTVA